MITDFTMQLGVQVNDIITGFSGTITGRVQYISGHNQYLVIPNILIDNKRPTGEWIDESRLEVISQDNSLGEKIQLILRKH